MRRGNGTADLQPCSLAINCRCKRLQLDTHDHLQRCASDGSPRRSTAHSTAVCAQAVQSPTEIRRKVEVESPALIALGLGFLLGLKHATDADHVVAVSTIVSEYRSAWRGIWVGASWGLGHTTPLLIVGTAILLIKGSLIDVYDEYSHYLEFGVGIMLVLLGLQVFWRLKGQNLHLHEHTHQETLHVHIHSHDKDMETVDKAVHPFVALAGRPVFRVKSYVNWSGARPCRKRRRHAGRPGYGCRSLFLRRHGLPYAFWRGHHPFHVHLDRPYGHPLFAVRSVPQDQCRRCRIGRHLEHRVRFPTYVRVGHSERLVGHCGRTDICRSGELPRDPSGCIDQRPSLIS